MENRGLATGKKIADDLGAHLVFLDESGLLLTPCVRRTWGVCGHPPVLIHRLRRQKFSAISALSVSPKRRRVGLFFRCLPNANFDNVEVASFLRHLLRHLRGSVVVVLDNGRCHKGDSMRAFLRCHKRIRLEPLPPYAPELNPDEAVWNQTRTTLANGRPDNPVELTKLLEDVLCQLSASQSKLRWCFHQSDLPPFLP